MAAEFQSLQEKYNAEAQKRLRADGLSQFQAAEASFSSRLRHLAEDSWVDHAALNAQLQVSPALISGDKPKFLIVGAGIGGIVSAVRLILNGCSADQIRIVDSAGGVGGTWYSNRYPGLHCDVEGYIYLPLLEEMGYMPSHKYTSGVEIRQYLKQIVQKFQLEDKILCRTKLDSLTWDEENSVWNADLTVSRGPACENLNLSVDAEFVVLTSGYLVKPQVPKLDGVGLEAFEGELMHTARWDYNVTGGSSEDVFPILDKLKDKTVGIIGTGATAIQAVPCLAKYAKELFVFQRTPSAVYARHQQETDPEEWKNNIASSSGWHKNRTENFSAHISNGAPPGAVDLVNDEWSRNPAYAALIGSPEFANTAPDQMGELFGHYLKLDAQYSSRVRAHTAEVVKDKETADALTAWYPVWCKRPTFSDTYLQAFNKPNVHLVDTSGKGINSTTAKGLVVKDTEYPLDVLVLATGYLSPFATGGDPSIRSDAKIIGRHGLNISQKWRDQGMTTLHGISSNGFPNLFWLGVLQSGVTGNFTHLIDTQSRHISHIIATAHQLTNTELKHTPSKKSSGVVVEVEKEAEDAWVQKIVNGSARFAVTTICTPGYISAEGAALRAKQGMAEPLDMETQLRMARMAMYSGGMMGFVAEMEEWQREGKLKGYSVGGSKAQREGIKGVSK